MGQYCSIYIYVCKDYCCDNSHNYMIDNLKINLHFNIAMYYYVKMKKYSYIAIGLKLSIYIYILNTAKPYVKDSVV